MPPTTIGAVLDSLVGPAPQIATGPRRAKQKPPRLYAPLSAREAEVLRLIGECRSNKQIADALFVSEKTVEKHRMAIHRKAGIQSAAQAVHLALYLKLTPIQQFPQVTIK